MDSLRCWTTKFYYGKT